MFPDACLYLSKNKQTEVVNENSEDLNQKIDVLGHALGNARHLGGLFLILRRINILGLILDI